MDHYSLENQGITQSLFTTYCLCRQKFLYNINNISGNNTVYNTNFGSIGHHCNDKIYSDFDTFNVLDEEGKIVFIKNAIGDYLLTNEDEASFIDATTMKNEIDLLTITLIEYFKYYRKSDIKWNLISVEEKFKEVVKVRDLNIILRGMIDGVYQLNDITQLEHKFKGRFNSDTLLQTLTFDIQNLVYHYVKRVIQGIKVTGVTYNIIRKSQLQKRVNEQSLDFIKRIQKDIQKRPEFYYQRINIAYTQRDLDQFFKTFSNILLEIDMVLKGTLPIIKNTACCEYPFKCEYLSLCATDSMHGYRKRKNLFPELDGV